MNPSIVGQYNPLKMSKLLKTLGDDWHNPSPYGELINKVLPNTKYFKRIQDALITIYVDSHYDYKNWKTPIKNSLYDNEIDMSLAQKKNLEEKMKQEEETFKKLCEKFQALGGGQKESSADEEQEEEQEQEQEEEEQDDGYYDEGMKMKSRKQETRVQNMKETKESKESKRKAAEQERLRLQQLKNTQTAMANVQQDMIDNQAVIDMLDKKVTYLGHYKKASLAYLNEFRKHIQEFEKTDDIQALIRNIEKTIEYSDTMKYKNISKDPCSGTKDKLCDTHFLPLFVTKWSEKGDVLAVKCDVHLH